MGGNQGEKAWGKRHGRGGWRWLAAGALLCQSLASAAPAPNAVVTIAARTRGTAAKTAALAAGTIVTTAVTASYSFADSTGETSQSNAASFVVGGVGGVAVSPAASSLAAAPGQSVCAFALQIQNTGSGSDQFAVKISAPDGWSAQLIKDDNGDGKWQAGETTPLTVPIALNAGGAASCFLRLACPAGLDAGGAVSVQFTSQVDSAQSAVFAGTVGAAPAAPAALHLGWRAQTGGPVMGEATLRGGVAYVGSDDGCLYAIAATPEAGQTPGTVLWRRQTGARVRGTPAVFAGASGREMVCAGNDAGRLCAWDAVTGQALWSAVARIALRMSWRARPLVSADGSMVTVPGRGAYLCSYSTARGSLSRRSPWRDISLAGNPTACDAQGGAWLTAPDGGATWVRDGLTGRRLGLGGTMPGALVIDAAQSCLLAVLADGHVAAWDTATLMPNPRWLAGSRTDLGAAVSASPALDSSNGLLYVAAAHAVYAVRTADGTMDDLDGWPFVPAGLAEAAFRAAPLLWPSQNSVAPTLYAGDTAGGFYAVPTDHPDQALLFVPEAGALGLGEWDAAPAASGTGPQDVVVAGNSNGGVYGFRLR